MKKLIYFLSLSFIGVSGQQIPQYYNDIDFNQPKEIVKQQIALLITKTHSEKGYNLVWDILDRADEDPENKDNVLLIYGYSDEPGSRQERSRAKTKKGKGGPTKDKWNREHVFAKSLGTPKLIGKGKTIDAGSDAHNLRAADVAWNSTRNNRIFEDAQGVSRKLQSGNWYPGDEWKGDVARIIMYMYLRYGTRTEPNVIGAGGSDIYKIPDMPDVFLKWNMEDPVSDFEKRRNQEIYYYQTNRNPFIDNPYLATIIWGGDKAEDTWGISVDSAVPKNDINKDVEFKIYPTLATSGEDITITEEVSSVEVYNMVGQLIHNYYDVKTFNAPKQSGVYIVRMIKKGNYKPIVRKIIVN